jgi:antirestriction protein ArdC
MTNRVQHAMDQITNRFIELIEQGIATGDWTQPWTTMFAGLHQTNIDGRSYHGVNQFNLAMTASLHGWPPRWGTLMAWNKINCSIRQGSKATTVLFWGTTTTCPDHNPCHDPTCDAAFRRHAPRAYHVFNIAQVTNPPTIITPPNPPIWEDTPERLLAALPLKIEQAEAAYYAPTLDTIHLPPRTWFSTPDGYYSTTFHEVAHWTGHPNRLNRDPNRNRSYGSTDYAKEELVAELSSAWLCHHTGVTPTPSVDAANYLAGWLQAARETTGFLYKSAGAAQNAVNYILHTATTTPEPIAA